MEGPVIWKPSGKRISKTLAAWLHPFPPARKPQLTGRLEAPRHQGAANLMARASYLPYY